MQKKGAASRPKKAAVASRVHVCACVCVHFATRRLLSDGRAPSCWTPLEVPEKGAEKRSNGDRAGWYIFVS